MRIIEEEQLDFDDVLIQPKRSTINSRKEVNIYRDIKWKDPNGEEHVLNCIPIMSANMGTVGTLEMAKHLSKAGYLCALEKHYTYDDIAKLFLELQDEVRAEYKEGDMPFGEEKRYTQRIFPTVGLDADLRLIRGLIDNFGLVGVTLDIANGYIARLVDEVKLLREQFPKLFIVAGNVVTADITTDLILAGANCVKVGIGGGCFQGNMKVMTLTGLKAIKDISVGEKVLTHTGKYEDVVNKFTFNSHKKIIDINGIKCTPNHKFYVAKIEDLDKITEENYKDYCIWIEAQNLDTAKYKLVKIIQNQD